jgi:hypothetical protein
MVADCSRTGLILLLTACIAPKPGIANRLNRNDPNIRLRDYAAGLRFWIEYPDDRIRGIVFADNSGHPLDSLRALAHAHMRTGRPVEFHSFDHAAPLPNLSYGFNEAILVSETLAASALLAESVHFGKVTGRYRFPDLSRLLNRLPPDFRAAVDTTGCWPWPWKARSKPISSFALALFQTTFYREHLMRLFERMYPAPPWDRCQYIESMIYDHLWPLRHEPGIILRWPCNCEPVGIAANGVDFRAPRRRLRAAIRAATRILLPHLWL